MDPLANALKSSQKGAQSSNVTYSKNDSFETEQSLSKNTKQPLGEGGVNPLAEALSKAGGRAADTIPSAAQDPAALEQQRLKLEKERRKKELKKKLHDRINPVDMHEVYSRHEERTKIELEKTRKDLEKLTIEIKKFYKEVNIVASQAVVNPGLEDGVGAQSFFEKLRQFILFLRKKIRSARTWMQQAQAKSKKKKARKIRGGIEIGGGKNEQTKAIFDQMHHEAANAFGGA